MRRLTTPISGNNSGKRKTIELVWARSAFGRARKTYDASLQELLLTVLTLGLKDYCSQRAATNDLRAVLPLGSRPSTSQTTNRHDPGLMQLPITCRNEIECITTIRKRLNRLREQQEQSVFETMTAFFERLPRMARARAAKRWVGLSQLLISVIPSPRLATIGGATVESIFALPALAPGHGLTLGIVCMKKTLCVAAQIDPAIIDSPADLETALQDAYQMIIEHPT